MICRLKVKITPPNNKTDCMCEKKFNRNSNSKSESAVLNWIILKSPDAKHFLSLDKVVLVWAGTEFIFFIAAIIGL